MKKHILLKLFSVMSFCGNGQVWAMYGQENRLGDEQRGDFRRVWLKMEIAGANEFACNDILDDITRKTTIDANKWTEVTCANNLTGLKVYWHPEIIAQLNQNILSSKKFTLFTGALFNGRLDVAQELLERELVRSPSQQLTDAHLAYAVRMYRSDIVKFIHDFGVIQGLLTQQALIDAQAQLTSGISIDEKKKQSHRENLKQIQEIIAPTVLHKPGLSVACKLVIGGVVVAVIAGLGVAAKIIYDLYFSKHDKQNTDEKDTAPADNTVSGSHETV